MSDYKYFPQIDGLRTLACFSVILHHYTFTYNYGSFTIGTYGVEVFFVISGFLITLILLNNKKQNSLSRSKTIKKFMLKRILRLFPSYYLVLAILLVASLFGGVYLYRGNIFYFISYASNYYFFQNGFTVAALTHTWSLAVEEQFYLIWPMIILFLPKKRISSALWIFVGFGIFFKIYFHGMSMSRLLPFYHFDSLGLGGLIAYYYSTGGISVEHGLVKLFKTSIFQTATIVTLLVYFYSVKNSGIEFPIAVTLVSSALLIGTIFDLNGFLGSILRAGFMTYLGKISYGLYLYHKLIPEVVNPVFRHFSMDDSSLIKILLSIAITIGVSILSFKYFESFFLKIKSNL